MHLIMNFWSQWVTEGFVEVANIPCGSGQLFSAFASRTWQSLHYLLTFWPKFFWLLRQFLQVDRQNFYWFVFGFCSLQVDWMSAGSTHGLIVGARTLMRNLDRAKLTKTKQKTIHKGTTLRQCKVLFLFWACKDRLQITSMSCWIKPAAQNVLDRKSNWVRSKLEPWRMSNRSSVLTLCLEKVGKKERTIFTHCTDVRALK